MGEDPRGVRQCGCEAHSKSITIMGKGGNGHDKTNTAKKKKKPKKKPNTAYILCIPYLIINKKACYVIFWGVP